MNEILSIKKDFKQELENLWNNPRFSEIEVVKRGYGLHEEIIKNSILFIGINPSFAKNSKREHKSYFINLDQDAKSSSQGKVYTYFKKFVDITSRINEDEKITQHMEWSHMDLLFFRETKQDYINKLMKENEGTEFISEQLKIAKKIILKSNPKLIVVSNTKARDFLKTKNEEISMGFDFKFDKVLGTEKIINEPILNNVPIFFTSMLTGQRALDKGSYERLIWHMKFVLEKLN